MRQIFILKSDSKLATGDAKDLTVVDANGLGIVQLDNTDEFIAAPPTGDFELIYGRPNSVPVIIEIGWKSAVVSVSEPQEGTKFKASVVIPTPEKGFNYTVELVKLGAIKHERNLYTVTDTYRVGKTSTAELMATSLGTQLSNMFANSEHPIKVTVSGATITVEAEDYQGWELKACDDLYGAEVTTETRGLKPTQDKVYMDLLASECAQNRGFNNTYADGASIYPGYPMEVEDTTYKVYNIHHCVSRKASRTRDEAVWQDVLIAVPVANTAVTGQLDTILKF